MAAGIKLVLARLENVYVTNAVIDCPMYVAKDA